MRLVRRLPKYYTGILKEVSGCNSSYIVTKALCVLKFFPDHTYLRLKHIAKSTAFEWHAYFLPPLLGFKICSYFSLRNGDSVSRPKSQVSTFSLRRLYYPILRNDKFYKWLVFS